MVKRQLPNVTHRESKGRSLDHRGASVMAYFRSKIQIPGLFLMKECFTFIRTPTPHVQQILRFFWFGKSKEPENKAIEAGQGNCGKPLPSRIEPCTGGPSKCLDKDYGKPVDKPKKRFFGFRKKPVVVKQKPSNCVEPKKVEQKLSLREHIFGPDPKKSWPNPCTCRLAHRKKMACRVEDPRLKDARYQATAGDVLLYTEFPKCNRRGCMEPQPKSPPSFKMPPAVLCKALTEAFEKMPVKCAAAEKRMNEKTVESTFVPKPYKIPYEELRPPNRRRRMFNCQEGIRSEDIMKPFSISGSYGVTRQTFKLDPESRHDRSMIVNDESKFNENGTESSPRRRSRVEQLKILINQKNASPCSSSTFSSSRS